MFKGKVEKYLEGNYYHVNNVNSAMLVGNLLSSQKIVNFKFVYKSITCIHES